MKRLLNPWSFAFGAILILGSLWLWISRVPPGSTSAPGSPEPAVGRPPPDFTLTTLGGESFTLADLKGTPVVLNFWATWCGPCQRELPELQAASERVQPMVRVIGVDQGEDGQIVQRYVDELGLTFTIPLDADMQVGNRYRIAGLPTTFFIDSQGIVRRIWAGEMNGIILAEGIRQIVP